MRRSSIGNAPKEGECSFQLELKSGYRRSRFGTPERGVASHLHDEEALWVIPVFFSLVDSPYSQGGGQRVDVRSYGYALYASKPYTGPGPAGRPESGDETDDEISEVTPDPGGDPGGGETGDDLEGGQVVAVDLGPPVRRIRCFEDQVGGGLG